MARRLPSSSCLIGIVLTTLFWCPLWAYVLVVATMGTIALYEFFTIVRRRGILVHRPLGIALGVTFTALVAWRSLIEPGLLPLPVPGQVAAVIRWAWDIFWPATIILIFIRQFTRENTFEALSGLATTLFGLAYIVALFSYFFYIRAIEPDQGAWLVCYLILVTKLGDAGAYGIGNLIGQHALIQRISPRKTIEGSLGAVAVGALTAWLAGPMLGGHPIFGQPPVWCWTLLLGVLMGMMGQLGDLAESLIKRDCQVKDTSQLVPGLGGILDVIDSLLFTAPLFYGILIYG